MASASQNVIPFLGGNFINKSSPVSIPFRESPRFSSLSSFCSTSSEPNKYSSSELVLTISQSPRGACPADQSRSGGNPLIKAATRLFRRITRTTSDRDVTVIPTVFCACMSHQRRMPRYTQVVPSFIGKGSADSLRGKALSSGAKQKISTVGRSGFKLTRVVTSIISTIAALPLASLVSEASVFLSTRPVPGRREQTSV